MSCVGILRSRTVALGVAGALVAAAASAQQTAAQPQQSQQLLATPVEGAASAELRVTRFRETFGHSPLESRRWSGAIGVELAAGGARLVAPADGPVAELRTQPIDLADDVEAELRVEIVASGPSPLTIEFLNNADRWRPLGEIVGPAAGESRSLALPPEALHPGFRARLRTVGHESAWLLGGLTIDATPRGAAHAVVLRSQPIGGARLMVVDEPPSRTTEAVTPARIGVAEADPVQVVAPAQIEGLAFLRWILDEMPQAARKRDLTLQPTRDAHAVAVYRREDAAGVAVVSVRSTPADGIRVTIGPDRHAVWDEDATAFSFECLTGESITLQAAPRTSRLLFARWIVDGARVAEPEPTLTFTASRDVSVVAAYVLLGDMNNDNVLDEYDVDPFCLALSRPEEYRRQFSDVRAAERGDVNADGVFDARDVGSFVELLMSE